MSQSLDPFSPEPCGASSNKLSKLLDMPVTDDPSIFHRQNRENRRNRLSHGVANPSFDKGKYCGRSRPSWFSSQDSEDSEIPEESSCESDMSMSSYDPDQADEPKHLLSPIESLPLEVSQSFLNSKEVRPD